MSAVFHGTAMYDRLEQASAPPMARMPKPSEDDRSRFREGLGAYAIARAPVSREDPTVYEPRHQAEDYNGGPRGPVDQTHGDVGG